MAIRRRAFLATTGALALPAIARGAATRELRVVPRGDPGALDATADPRAEVASAALLVFDTLYGVDSQLEPRPQMCAGHEVSDDRLTWTLRLRPGLRFHDGTAVRAADAAASLRRWMARDRLGLALRDRLAALEAPDDLTLRVRLRAPFGRLLYALGKSDPPLAVVMPEALALSDPATPLARLLGSGPLCARQDEWQPGSRLVFGRFDGYAPREEAADWLAGGKRILFDRVIWNMLPDPAQAAEALQGGEADWWSGPTPELTPVLKRNRNIVVDIADPLGQVTLLRLNPAIAPFDSAALRGAVRASLDQTACMTALTGGDDALWRPMDGLFPPGSPAARATGPAPSDAEADARRRAVTAAAGAGAVVLASADAPGEREVAQVVAGVLRRLGLLAEARLMTQASLQARLAEPERWHARIARLDGGTAATPAGYADVPALAEALADWLAAATPSAAAMASDAANRAALADATVIPLGQQLRYQAWRTSLSGIVKAPLPMPWDVRKT